MTKFEFLTECDFNNLSLSDKIKKVIELLDGNYPTLSDKSDSDCFIKCDAYGNLCDGDSSFMKANDELSKANMEFISHFPQLEEIMRSLQKNRSNIEKTLNDLTQ
jgi:hypothetical protein